jgi:hypothetical protein
LFLLAKSLHGLPVNLQGNRGLEHGSFIHYCGGNTENAACLLDSLVFQEYLSLR